MFHDPFFVQIPTSFLHIFSFISFWYDTTSCLFQPFGVLLDVPALGIVVYMWRERLCIIHGMVNWFSFRCKIIRSQLNLVS